MMRKGRRDRAPRRPEKALVATADVNYIKLADFVTPRPIWGGAERREVHGFLIEPSMIHRSGVAYCYKWRRVIAMPLVKFELLAYSLGTE
jgi:hypothetical protein